MRQSFRDDGYANLVLLPRVEDEWPIAERRNGYSRTLPLSPLLRISSNHDDHNHNSQSQPTFHNVLPGDRHIVLLRERSPFRSLQRKVFDSFSAEDGRPWRSSGMSPYGSYVNRR